MPKKSLLPLRQQELFKQKHPSPKRPPLRRLTRLLKKRSAWNRFPVNLPRHLRLRRLPRRFSPFSRHSKF